MPDDIKKTFERLGIPEQERKFLAGVEAPQRDGRLAGLAQHREPVHLMPAQSAVQQRRDRRQ